MRARWLQALLLVLILSGILYLVISLYLPSPRRLTFGIHRQSGHVRLADSGVTFLPPHAYRRMSFTRRDGAAQSQGVARIHSREGVPVKISYRVRFELEHTALPDARTIIQEGWEQWVESRVAEAVQAVARQTAIEEFLSPVSRFSARRDLVRQTVADHLARSGLKVTGFEIEGMETDRQALLEFKRRELRRKEKTAVSRVVVFGVDGADWSLIDELIDDGRLPNIAALVQGGVVAEVESVSPPLAPVTWATLSTGVLPSRHGVMDFFDRQNRQMPVNAVSRNAPAIWEVAVKFDRPTVVVSWWTAWPPLVPEVVVASSPLESDGVPVFPLRLRERVGDAVIPRATVGYSQVRRFMNLSENEFQKSVSRGQTDDPIVAFRSVLAKGWSDHRIALELYQEIQPMLLLLGFQGADVVHHLFGPYHPPYRERVAWESYRRFWPTVGAYYVELDRMIGEWLELLPDDTTVMLVSAHGSVWGSRRPIAPPSPGEALAVHDDTGVLIAYGQHVPASRRHPRISIYDVAPTILALLGIPSSGEMRGRVAEEIIQGIEPIEDVRIASFTDVIRLQPELVGSGIDPDRYGNLLAGIGHLAHDRAGPAPMREERASAPAGGVVSGEAWSGYAAANNRGVRLAIEGKRAEAISEFEKAVEMNPARPTPYLNLAMVALQSQRYTSAEELFLTALDRGIEEPERMVLDFAAWYRAHDMPTRAIAMLQRARERFAQSSVIAAALGATLLEVDRLTEAQPELERALAMEPLSTTVLNNLGILHARRRDWARALDYWNRSLAIAARQPKISEAARAAVSRL